MVSTVAKGHSGSFHQRYCFYAQGLHWVFFTDGTDFVYCTSAGGATWSDPIIVYSPSMLAMEFSVALHDDYVHIVMGFGGNAKYRRGMLGSDGSITWSAAWQDTGMGPVYYPTIAIDSDGYPWIGVQYKIALLCYSYVSKSSTIDGTWVDDVGFPYELSNIPDVWTFAIPVALTGGKVYVVYGYNGVTAKGKLYDGGWGAEEVISTEAVYIHCVSASSYNDEVKLVFLQGDATSTTIYYVERDSVGSWSAEKKLFVSSPRPTAQRPYVGMSTDLDNGDVYVIWACNGVIYFQKKGSAWDSEYTEWFNNETVTGEWAGITIFLHKYERNIGAAWSRGSSAPYDLRYDTMTILPSSIKSSHTL